METTMIEKLMTMLVGILLALAGWSLSRTFELSTIQAVHEDKVQKLERQLEKMEDKMDKMMDSDEEIMQQHEDLFKKLQEGNTPSTGYSYN
jgi:TolA-binding protein